MSGSSKPIARVGVADRQHEEDKAEHQQDDVEHGRPLLREASNNDRIMFSAIKMRYEFSRDGINEK